MDDLSRFNTGIIKIGVITVLAAIVGNFLPPLYLLVFHGVSPTFGDIVTVYGILAASFAMSWIVQPLSFYPLLGVGGTYIAWTAGTVTSLRIPPRAMAIMAADAEDGTLEGEVVGLIGLATSVFVQVSIVTLFFFIGSAVLPMLPPFIIDAFKYILPAVFGALYADLSLRFPKLGVCALISGLLIMVVGRGQLGVPDWAVVLLSIAAGLVLARVLFKMEAAKKAA